MQSWFRFQPRLLVQRPKRTFLLCFLLLNGLLFLPLYLFNWEETTLLPLQALNGTDWRLLLRDLLIGRDNFDPFRFNVELFLFIALWVNIRWLRRPALRHLFVGAYFFILSYYIYEAVTLTFYQSEPVFYSHYYLALDGLGYAFEHLNVAGVSYVVATLAVVVVVWLIYRLAALFYQSTLIAQWSAWGRLFFTGIGVLMLFVMATEQHTLAAPTTVLSSLSFKMEDNIEKSLALYQQVIAFDDSQLQQTYDYSAFTLPRKPNVYFLFVESYGSVLYKRPDYRLDYAQLLKKLKRQLDDADWQSTSTLSVSPTWGGGSWLAYTSTQFGLHIDNHPFYLTLLDKYQLKRYPHLGSFLHDQGYQTYRLSSLSANLAENSWDRYERMYDVDRWFRFEDLAYTGALYGWGPAAPDQYALHYAHDQIRDQSRKVDKSDQPFMLFFITQSSHYPFAPIPSLVDDWHTLNQPVDPAAGQPSVIDDDARDHATRRQDYFNSIDYGLNTLVQFILHVDDKDALFVLIGDHQPPRVSRRDDGFDTPIHIISRDGALITAFQEQGFTPGLWVSDPVPTMKHEGLYSMLVRALLSDGNNAATLPPYLPDGFVPSTMIDGK